MTKVQINIDELVCEECYFKGMLEKSSKNEYNFYCTRCDEHVKTGKIMKDSGVSFEST